MVRGEVPPSANAFNIEVINITTGAKNEKCNNNKEIMIPSDNAMAHEEWAAKPSGGQEDSKRVWSGCASPLIEQQHGDDMHVQLCMIFSEQNQASELPSARRADQQNCKRTPRRRRQCATSHGEAWNKRTKFGLWPTTPTRQF